MMTDATAILHALSGAMPDAIESRAAWAALLAAACAAYAIIARGRACSARSRGDSRPCLLPASARPAVADEPVAARVLIVGAGERGRDLARAMLDHPELGCRPIGFVDDEPGMPGWDGIPLLGGTRDLGSLVERHGVDEIMVAHAPSWQETLMSQLVASGQDDQVRVSSAVGLREAMSGDLRLRRVAEIPLVAVNGRKAGSLYRRAKRCFDIIFSLGALTVSAAPLAVLALLVKLTSRGPAFFCQRRVGLHHREFTIYKLRTMVADAERDTGPVLADPYDARVTPLGRLLRVTRLDELPQFVNVLRGDMSVVGPRPERPEFTAGFVARVPGYAKRLTVKPGITGLAQVCGGYDTDVHTKLRYDWMYLYRQSVWLDLRILLRTLWVVLSCAGR
jgi:exopolysaccharide biosynthesis polyprenyl glycosylphosphotransferase